jgi:hypothetical protein
MDWGMKRIPPVHVRMGPPRLHGDLSTRGLRFFDNILNIQLLLITVDNTS